MTPESRLSADAPTKRMADDELGRADFVEVLAEDIRHAPRGSGFVIGLSGPWGSGKTSVLEMVGDELGEEDVTAVVRFNPWLFSGTEQLVDHFFTELSGQLETDAAESVSKIAKALRGYGRIVSPLRYLPYVGEIARVSGEAATDAGAALAGEEEEAETARARAQELRSQLQELDRPVVILLDDLDRLRREEIVDVVRLVRLVGDFPNLVYLLAFDRPAVERALGEDRAQGRSYLEKIIHLSHDLPPVRPEKLAEIIETAIEAAVPDPSIYRFDQDRHASIFLTEIRPMFTTVRDIRRYRNALGAALRLVGDEVDLTDLLALEALRLFEPEFFEALFESRDLLTGRLSSIDAILLESMRTGENEEAKQRMRELVALPSRQANFETLLKRLFPHCAQYFDGPSGGLEAPSDWRAKRRVADAEVFDTYLYRRLSPGTLPAAEVDRAVRAFGGEEALDEVFGGFDKAELLGLLDRLVNYPVELAPELVAPTINSVLRQAWRISGGSFSEISGSLLIHELLRGLAPEQVMAVLDEVSFPSLSGRYEVLRMVARSESSGERLVGEVDARRLERDLCAAVVASSAEQLLEEEDIGPLVTFVESTDAQALARKLPEWIGNDAFFIRLLASRSVGFQAGPEGKQGVQLLWPRVVELFGVEVLRAKLTQIKASWVDQEFAPEVAAAWHQALAYLDDPERGESDAARYEVPPTI